MTVAFWSNLDIFFQFGRGFIFYSPSQMLNGTIISMPTILCFKTVVPWQKSYFHGITFVTVS